MSARKKASGRTWVLKRCRLCLRTHEPYEIASGNDIVVRSRRVSLDASGACAACAARVARLAAEGGGK